MKHARADYNRIQDPAEKIPADEPVFLLRGQDIHAPGILFEYAERVRAAGGDLKIVELTRNQAQRMSDWQRDVAHKAPDV